jgi:hypothetical protein
VTSKIHLAADTRCRSIRRVTTVGHRHDSLAFEAVMAGIRIRRQPPLQLRDPLILRSNHPDQLGVTLRQ